ncbi:hypothetical protein OSB04_020119 [Centaurea solstitialis]|uniref:TLC domain-containing protein n=1 Tax=Centaurea solstitialis TaxID=347529 RepID=A0AA38T510_9ASTR|nr:hypothetical protein OSB04_020119 [Centaurea solstitialis]
MVHQKKKKDRDGLLFLFFMGSLVIWGVSVLLEIVFSKRSELFPVLIGFCFYQIANWVCRYFFRDPLFVNTCVSLLHSSLTSASAQVAKAINQAINKIKVSKRCNSSGKGLGPVDGIHWSQQLMICDGWDELFEHSQLVKATWGWAYPALCISCGYFAYDQLDMLLHGLYTPSILLHHLLLLGCFTLALYRNVTINYLILTLICELHSIFLHVRKVRRMAGFRDSNTKFVKIEWFLNMVTFLLARLLSHLLITIKLVKDAAKFDQGIELPLALFGMAGMNLLNVFLGVDIFKAFKREKNSHRR